MILVDNPILFLGAGFSYGSTNVYGKMATGNALKTEIIKKYVQGVSSDDEIKELEKWKLEEVCEYVAETLNKKAELKSYLISRFSNVNPAKFHYLLVKYPWKKIYTVNIDDLVEHIYKKEKIEIVVQNEKEKKINDTGKLEYIKLHGCVNKPEESFVFSSSEYTNLITSRMNYKHNDLISDIQNESFIFVGASLEERDIEFYISCYEKAGYQRRKRIIFIDPNPSLKLKSRVQKTGGSIIEWTTEKFLYFVDELNFNPTELQKRKMQLNYSGIYQVRDILNSFSSSEVYESRLYEGYNSNWKDVKDGWLFEPSICSEVYRRIENVDFKTYSIFCVALYGSSFSGKNCILKIVGLYLDKTGYEVLEFKGKKLSIPALKEYIIVSPHEKFALLVEDASYYYRLIEKLLSTDIGNKKLLVITTSRNYYHMKKRYYLEGNPYVDIQITDSIDKYCAQNIYDKLKEKGLMGDLPLDEHKAISAIMREKNYVNFFSRLTFGSGFQQRLRNAIKEIIFSNPQIKGLFVELTIFDMADLPYYPYELLTMRYDVDFNIFQRSEYFKLPKEQRLIADYAKTDDYGLTLKNLVLRNGLWKKLTDKEKVNSLINILQDIAPYVDERENNYWKIVFESILKEDCLEKHFHLNLKTIIPLYYKLKDNYSGISYYWLQLGIAEQKCNDYVKALNHLNMALTIRPTAYQIQHAIGRNYLRHAYYEKDNIAAEALFAEGESRMLKLINSSEYYKEKARNFSIHCYVNEKLRFMQKKKLEISNKELLQIKHYIDMIINDKDVYVEGLISRYVAFLKEKNKLDIISMTPGDKYYQTIGKNYKYYDMGDKLIDSY